MIESLEKIKLINPGYLILDSQQLYGENFLMDSRFRNKYNNFSIEPELPKELRKPLEKGDMAYIEFIEDTEYDNFWRKIERHDFMRHHLETLIGKTRTTNIVRGKVYSKNLSFYQGYENGESPGDRVVKEYHGELNLTLEKTEEGFNLFIPKIFSY